MTDTHLLPRQGTRQRTAPGMVLYGLKLIELIGKGGMGEVWRAENVRVPAIVRAVKVIDAGLAGLPDFRARFLREAEFLDALQHPNVLTVHTIGEDQDLLFMVMELLQGQGLDRVLSASAGRLDPKEAVGLVLQALVGVAHAHARGIVHRDLKPQNLFLTTSGTVKVLDFGIARAGQEQTQLTAVGQAPGTPAYLAPEVAEGGPATPRSDVYAMGISLYELLMGAPPFRPAADVTDYQAALSVMYQHATKPLPDVQRSRPELPAGLVEVLSKATAKKADERYPDAGPFALALEPYATPAHRAALGSLTPPSGIGTFRRLPSLTEDEASPTKVPGADGSRGPAATTPSVRDQPSGPEPGVFEAKRRSPRVVLAVGAAFLVLAALTWFGAQGSHRADDQAKQTEAGRPERRGEVKVPKEMVVLAGGSFTMGRPAYGNQDALDTPPHLAQVARIAIARAETTNAEYQEFVSAGQVDPPHPLARGPVNPQAPVVNVPHDHAARFCKWRFGGRLPTEEEWEWSARGATGRLYPWGDEPRRACMNGLAGEGGSVRPADPGSCGATPEGVLDLSGNVWEWTDSRASLYPGSRGTPPARGLWVVRGGSYYNEDPDELTGTARLFVGAPTPFIGFRCVLPLAE